MSSVAIIPARGGSKRIPRKNIRDFLGRPVIAYPIETALASGLFNEVMVSTEDEEIATIARQYGAQVPFIRSQENADDFATTADVLLEVLSAYQEKGIRFKYACCIYPITPLLKPDLLMKGFSLLKAKNLDSVFPVLSFSHPIQRALRITEDEKAEMFYPEYLLSRSQDLEPAYHDSGQFYWFRVDRFQETGQLWTDNSGAIRLDPLKAQDIDTLEDWRMAELKYKLLTELEA